MRNGNVVPGTVVDTDITHPTVSSYYLASHEGIQVYNTVGFKWENSGEKIITLNVLFLSLMRNCIGIHSDFSSLYFEKLENRLTKLFLTIIFFFLYQSSRYVPT